MSSAESLTEYLTMTAKMGDPVAALLLTEGETFTKVVADTEPYGEGEPGNCYQDALHLALAYGLRYCEGYAAGIIPMQHAWCLTDDDEVIDITWAACAAVTGRDWPPAAPAYHGVVVDPGAAVRAVLAQDVYGLLTWSSAAAESLCRNGTDGGSLTGVLADLKAK